VVRPSRSMAACLHVRADPATLSPTKGGITLKGSQKPKKLPKKAPQKTLKQRRVEKRAAAGERTLAARTNP
jgi:hypothetical protein